MGNSKIWIVKRHVVEYYEVEAANRSEASRKVDEKGDPHTVIVTREIIREKKNDGDAK